MIKHNEDLVTVKLPKIIIIFRIWQCLSKRSIFQNEVHQARHQPRLRLLQCASCEVWDGRILGHLFNSRGAVVTKEVVAAVHTEEGVHVFNDQTILGSEETIRNNYIDLDNIQTNYLCKITQLSTNLTWLSGL